MIISKQHIYSILFVSILFGGCKSSTGQNDRSNCSKNITIQYHTVSKEDIKQGMVVDKSENNVVVFLEAYFDGVVKGYARNELIFNENIVTDESLGTTGKYITYDYSDDNLLPKLRVEIDGDCLEFEIKKEYKLIFLSHYQEEWDIIYSNVYPTYE